MSTEQRRNQGTTQIACNQGLVVKAPADIDLFLTSDWHCGSEACDYPALREMLRRVQRTKHARLILGGDQMEQTPPTVHDGGRYSDSDPDHQIIRTANALETVRDRIDLIYRGNHGHDRFIRMGIDPDLLLANILKVPYSIVPTVIQYRNGKNVVRVCGAHGRSSARNSMLELEKLRTIYPHCDIYHEGHTHCLYAEQAGALEYDASGREHWSPHWLCRTGSFLRYGEYARYGILRPKPTGYLVAKIRKAEVKEIEVVKA